MSGFRSEISLSSPREPKRVSIHCVTLRVIANPANTQKPTSQSQRKRKKTTRAPLSLSVDTVRPMWGRQSSVITSMSGRSTCSWQASRRAGASCPSPTLAVRIRIRGAIGAGP